MKKIIPYFGRLYCNMHKRGILLVFLIMITYATDAQGEIPPDFLRSTGKIYVVALVTLVILLSIFAYLIILDRKITRLEKRHKNE